MILDGHQFHIALISQTGTDQRLIQVGDGRINVDTEQRRKGIGAHRRKTPTLMIVERKLIMGGCL